MQTSLTQAEKIESASSLLSSFSQQTGSVQRSGQGVVNTCIYGPDPVETALAASALIEHFHIGLPFEDLEDLRSSLGLPIEELERLLGISPGSIPQIKESGRLAPAESQRILRFARLMNKAIEVLESVKNARQWLLSHQVGLAGEIPLEFAKTVETAHEVENLLGRIEYGVYS